MPTTIEIPKNPSPQPNADRILLESIAWETYEALVRDLESQPGLRLTYDRGRLEIMTPLVPHESCKKLTGRFIEALTEELEIEIRSLGSLTCKRRDLARGLEPDQCYYIQNELAVRGKDEIDFERDPPPDLAIEIDITNSSIDCMAIYAALGVPELWRYDGNRVIIYRLENQNYRECHRSPTFPQIAPVEILRFLEMSQTMGETSLLRSFRQWVRSQ
ncbi:MAG TPA: Uma2 family endonuclease [Oscillatoriales cyanobacterium M59_W2019_021]|nr:MAG: Uma2 family endonuclease [Cyanobacteria bacterium J055]HIK30935.1 Uma2 family endonuclease [Oscillatoriales cyanobacterium M4454_W2019_049]HIK52224.1 Uma2 family endonuclease [Oscillatoriales cyanobacterium M59_W2019_021]